MPLFHIVILALIQGITEFLPVSSSGHLVLFHSIVEQGATTEGLWGKSLTLDVAVHVGTLFSVLLYFRKDILSMLCGLGRKGTSGQKTAFNILWASLPVIAAGYVLHLYEPSWVRSVELTAWCTVLFGLLLWVADRQKISDQKIEQMGGKQAIFIGLSQILALVPGTSRSGITMTAARFLGFSRTEAARFSLLLAVIAISGAGTLAGIDLWQSGDLSLGLDVFLAVILSFFAGWCAIALMMRWLEKATFMPFVCYRMALGLLLLGLIYSGLL